MVSHAGFYIIDIWFDETIYESYYYLTIYFVYWHVCCVCICIATWKYQILGTRNICISSYNNGSRLHFDLAAHLLGIITMQLMQLHMCMRQIAGLRITWCIVNYHILYIFIGLTKCREWYLYTSNIHWITRSNTHVIKSTYIPWAICTFHHRIRMWYHPWRADYDIYLVIPTCT